MKLQKFLYLLLGGALLYGTYLFCHKKTAGFQVVKVLSFLPSSPDWDIVSLDTAQRAEIFKQPFRYLHKGGQSFAFLSADGKTVLKLFKMQNIRQYPFLYKIALPGIADQLRFRFLYHQKSKLNRLFNSCCLAYRELKEETGLIDLNLNPNPDLKDLYVTLIDKLGITHRLELQSLPFALQKKVTLSLKKLRASIKKKELDSAQEIVRQMVLGFKEKHAKGIIDIDPAFKRNIGLLEGRAIFMDIGSFFAKQQPLPEENFLQETEHLHQWLKKHSPEMAIYMESLR